MLESLVASILNRFLGNYVSNLNYDQLNIGIWNGEANLRDLKLRREALDKLDLPIDVLEGYLGQLTLSIPWSNLKTKPVKVFVENVYLLAVPKTETSISLEEEEERAQSLKQRRLDTADLISKSSKQGEQKDQSDEGNDGFISQLTTKIVDNLQVSIKNIHLRFEDNVSDPGHPFAAGITLKELSAVSTDGEWHPTFINEMTNTIHKLATLHSLSVYWNTDARSLAGLPHEEATRVYTDLIPDGSNDTTSDAEHQYILKPVSGTGKVKLNKQFGKDVAKTDVTLLFEELGICLDDHQYRDAILLVDLFHANLKKQKYLKYHPGKGAKPKTNPRAYWKFAQDAVLSEIHERHYKWTWDHFRTRRDQRKAYIESYSASKLNKATPEQKEKLEKLERDLSFEDIRFYRSLARSKLKREKIKIEQEKKKAANENKGWFSSWWSGSTNTSSDKNGDDSGEQIVMTEEQKRELYEAIDYDEEKASIAASVDMPKDTKKLLINTKLNRGSLTLMKHNGSDQSRRDLTSLVFDTVTADVIQYIESARIAVGLGDLRLYDNLTPKTIYPQLIGARSRDGTGRSLAEAPTDPQASSHSGALSAEAGNIKNEPLFKAVIEHKPFDHIADNAIKLSTKRLEIIYNPAIVKGIMDFFKPPDNNAESINALLEVAGDTFEELKQQTRAGLEYALDQHTTLDIDFDMDAPLIIIPESCVKRNTACMIIDAGHIHVDSELTDPGLVHDLKSKKHSKEDYQKLESLMYDKFRVGLSQTKLLIATDVEDCLAQQQGTRDGHAHVIERIDMNFLVELCILQRAAQFTKLKVSGDLPLLSLSISDTKYKILMRMIDLILDSISDDDAKAVAQAQNVESQKQQQRQQFHDYLQTSWTNKNNQRDLWISDTESEASSSEPSSSITMQRQRSADISTPLSSSSSSYMGGSMRYQQEQFRFAFQVNKVSATVYETSSNGDDVLLCELNLDMFKLEFLNRPFDMLVDVSLRSLNIVDKMEHGDEFHYLVTSDTSSGDRAPDENLVSVKYMQVNRTHPMYQEIYHGFDQTVEIALSTLNIVVTRSSILTLYNFVLNTFAGPPGSVEQESQKDASSSKSAKRLSSGSVVSTTKDEEEKQNASSSNTIKVTVHMDSLDLILNDDGKRLGTAILSYGDLTVLLYPNTLKVSGRFGNLKLTDDTVIRGHAQSKDIEHGASEVHLLTIQGDELADFIYETFDRESSTFPGYDSRFYLHMGAFQFMLLDTVKPTLDFLSEFLEMKTVYDAAREAAAQQMQETDTRMHYDITIKSPVVIFPVSENDDTVIANLGEIRAANEFVNVKRRRTGDLNVEPKELAMTKILCGLYTISLHSRSIVKTKGEQRERILPIIDNLNITFDIQSPEKAAPEWGPATSIIGHISDVRMALTENQYKWLLDIYNKVMSTFLAGENDANGEVNDDEGEDVTGQSVHSSQFSQLQKQHRQPIRGDEKAPATDKKKKKKKSVSIQLDMVMDVDTVCLEILSGPDLDFKDWGKQRLARLAFNGTSMKMQTHSDTSLLLEVRMNSITFTDTRQDSQSQFKDIMSASHLSGAPQLQVQLQMPAQDEEQIMFVRATVDSPKIVLSLDYVFLLVNFFMKPFAPEPTTEAQAFAKTQRERLNNITGNQRDQARRKSTAPGTNGSNKKARSIASSKKTEQQRQQQQAQPMQLHYSVNVVDVQVACLAKPEVTSSEAIIFSFKELSAVQKQSLTCKLGSIGMVLCRMDVRDESSLPFIHEFDIDLKMETSSNMPGSNITVIDIDVEPLIVRLSYNDAMLVLDIINKAIALMGAGGSQKPAGAQGYDDGSFSNQQQSLALPESGAQDNNDKNQENAWAISRQQKIEPYIVMTKESLKARFQGLQFTLIEDLHDLPFIDAMLQPFTVNASDWSSALSADVFFNMSASSFNFRNSHWEPVIEPYGFGIKVSQDAATKSMQIGVESNEFLNLNITHAFLETMMAVSGSMFEEQPLSDSGQKQVRPYLIRNYTGHEIRFWNMSDDAQKEGGIDNRMYKLQSGEEKPWTFRDWKRRRERTNLGKNLLGVQVEAFDWESFQHIPLDQEGQHSYRMKPEVRGVSHRLIVDIQLKNHVKQVTFRSGLVIQNHAAEGIKVALVNAKRKFMSPQWHVAPGGEQVVPIELVYDYWLVAKPAEGDYHWSQPGVHWSDITHPDGPRSISCGPPSSDSDAFKYQINGVYDKLNPIAREYPIMAIQIDAPIELENSLPFPISFEMADKTQGVSFQDTIAKGGNCHVHTISNYNHVALSIEVPGTHYMPSQLVDLDLDEDSSKAGTRIQPIELLDKDGRHPLHLQLSIARLSKANNALYIKIYTPYLILNKSRQPISLKSRISHRQSKHLIYEIPAAPDHDELINPFMFSFPEMDRKNRVQLAVNESKWSDPLSFEAVGSIQDVTLPTTDNVHQIHLGVHVEEGVGMYHMTRLVTISPRFILKNNLGDKIKYSEFGVPTDDSISIIENGQRVPLYHLSKSNIRWLCLCQDQEGALWSSPFDMQQIGDTHIKLEVTGESRPMLVRISIVLKDAAIFIFLEREETWPYLVINLSSVPVTFSQTDTGLEDYKLKDRQRKALPQARQFSLEPHDRMEYSWCMPVAHDKRIQLDVFGKKRDVNFQAIGTQMPLRYKRQAQQHRSSPVSSRPIMSIDVIARDAALVLVLSDFNPEISLYQPKSSGASVSATSSREASSREGSLRDTFETVEVDYVVNYSFELNLAGIGISVVNKRMQEMAYATIRALEFKYTDSNLYQSVRASIQWLQVDNQFHGSLHPILCFPTTLPKNVTEQETHPTFHMALDKIKDEAHGVYNFKVFSILLQEMTFAADEDFLYCLMEFAQFSSTPQEIKIDETALFSTRIAEPVVQNTPALYYFQEFCIQPMRLNLAFSRTDRINAIDEDDEVGRSPLRYVFDVFTMTIGNVNDAPIKLNALIVENLRVSYEDLMDRIMLHYRGEIIYQVHRVLGSVDVIGNPVGLFSNLSSGFGELFYEPYQGFIMSDRPQDLGIGIARGVGGLAKKVLFGVSDSMSRITGSIGKGLSAATLDKKFQDRRRINLARNKPQHAFYGVSQGVGYFGLSIASGVAGLYKRPLEGAESGGVVGFAGGVGRGLVGVVTKPFVGFFDMASNVTAGVRETTTIFDPNDITRERLPRYVGIDGILRSYSQREALGQLWLKELKGARYFHDTYIAHSTAQSDEKIAILTYQRIIFVGIRKGDVEYDIGLDQIESLVHSVDGIHLRLKQPTTRTMTLPIDEETSREWLATKIQNTMDQRKEDKGRQ